MAPNNQFRPKNGLSPGGSRKGLDDDFDPDELRPVPYRPDTEVTLGPMWIGGIVFSLILLCGLCFVVGYAIGKRGAHGSPANAPKQGAPVAPPGNGSAPKPAAAAQNPSRSQRAENQPPYGGTDSALVSDTAVPVSPAPLATAPAQAVMVQIAAVSHKEDAEVLIGALRKRGYAVTSRREPTDSLIHVRVGPFTNLADANATRQKLLNDGYNASVQP